MAGECDGQARFTSRYTLRLRTGSRTTHRRPDLSDEGAPEGRATHRLIMRELEGLIAYEKAQAIMEDFGLFMNHRPVDPRTEPGQNAQHRLVLALEICGG